MRGVAHHGIVRRFRRSLADEMDPIPSQNGWTIKRPLPGSVIPCLDPLIPLVRAPRLDAGLTSVPFLYYRDG